MAWELNNEKPIYVQLMDYIRLSIISGKYNAGDKLPSVRDLAHIASVNPNTMQKALSELESTQLIFSNRTSGRFVTNDAGLISRCRKNLAMDYCKEFHEKLISLGLTQTEINELIDSLKQEPD